MKRSALSVLAILILAVATIHAGTTAWVGNMGSDSISIIDISDIDGDTVVNEVLFTVKPMCFPLCAPGAICGNTLGPCINGPHDISFSPDGYLAYITAFDGDQLITMDTSGLLATPPTAPVFFSRIAAGDRPQGVVVSPDGSYTFVANSFSDNVQVYDTSQGIPSAVTTVSVENDPNGITITPDGARVLVTNNLSDSISEIETTGFTVTETLELEDAEAPRRIVLGDIPLGGGSELRAYTVNADTDNVTVIDISSSTMTFEGDPIPLDNDGIDKTARPRGIALTPNHEGLYVTEFQSAQLTKIVTLDNTTEEPLDLDYSPHRIAIAPDGLKAYVANPDDEQVSVITLSNGNVLLVEVENTPGSVAILVQD